MTTRLFTTYFEDQHAERRAEVELCLTLNAAAFDSVCVRSEQQERPDWLPTWWVITDTRPTFASVLGDAMESHSGDITIIANTDIIIPQRALHQIERSLGDDQAYCLSRWELATMELYDQPYTQDAWVIRGRPRPGIGGDYYFGVPGCDNRFTHDLMAAGYDIRNPSREIRTYHHHGSGKRTATNTRPHRVPPPYTFIEPATLGESPERQTFNGIVQMQRAMRERRRSMRRRAAVGA